MPLCAYQDARLRSDETIVENAFIRDYMPFAPNSCVKVYLYGLMQCQSGVGESTPLAFAHALGMDEGDVRAAFDYWHEKGLVSVNTIPAYAVFYKSVRAALPLDETVYEYSEFNAQVQAIFSPRVPTPSELSIIYDWMDVFSIEQQAIPLLLEYARSHMKDIGKATIGQQIRYTDRIASHWAEDGIRTAEQAGEWVAAQQQHSSGMTALMRRMGMTRQPMKAEKKMYDGWLNQGFTPEAIIAAADKMTGAFSPSFKYLNTIIQELHNQGITDEQGINSNLDDELCREAITALGFKDRAPTANQMRQYRECIQQGFDHEHVLLACEIANSRGKRNMNDVSALLQYWKEMGLSGIRPIRKHEKRRTNALADMKEAFSRMGLEKRPAEADIQLYEKWANKGMSSELVLYAAECSHGAGTPYKYMQKLMDKWGEAGITGVGAARKHNAAKPAAAAASNPALAYEQRSYQEGELDYLIDEL